SAWPPPSRSGSASLGPAEPPSASPCPSSSGRELIMSQRIGYARVSAADQNPQLQLDALKEAGCEKIFVEKMTGTLRERPQLAAALAYIRPGDVLVVWKLDRLGRSLLHLIEVVTGLRDRGVDFRSLKESIDTTTATGRLIFHILAALAEFERDMI